MSGIGGSGATLKPWQIILVVLACCLAIGVIPFISHLLTKQKHADVTNAVMAGAADATGTPYFQPIVDKPPAHAVEPVAARPLAPPADSPLISRQPLPMHMPGTNPGAPTDQRLFGQAQSGAPQPPVQPVSASGGDLGRNGAAPAADSLAALLKPTEVSGYSAARVDKPWAKIGQGTIIGCKSVTRMTSQLSGFVTAKVTGDVRSMDGTTVLVERNSDMFGEIAHGLVQGQDRLFVLWRQITTPMPNIVRITLNAPAADELGEAGLPGDINHHTWRKIGGALMLSGIDIAMQGAVLALTASLQHGNNNGYGGGSNLNFYQFQGQGSSLAGDLLSHTLSIPDTLSRDQGLPCSAFVSGDLDFSTVYDLIRRR
jgi:type IV secretory pathway VirB10-like protein